MAIETELRLRLLLSCFISAFVSTASLFFFVFVQNISLSYPYNWFLDAIAASLSFWPFILFICNGLIVCAVAVVLYRRLAVSDRVLCKVYEVCGNLLLWQNLQVILCCITLGAANTLALIKILATNEYSSVFSPTHFFLLNPRTHCLLSCGAFMGFVFAITVLIFNRTTLLFSQPHHHLILIVKENILTKSLSTLGRIIYFLPLYALLPKPLCGPSDQVGLWYMLLDLRLYLLMFVIGLHLHFTWGCALSIVKWQLTKPIDWPLTSIVTPSESIQVALQEHKSPIQKHLILERLADLVAINADVRSTIFSLSRLGGQPVLWRQISSQCISILEQFVNSAQAANELLASGAGVRGFGWLPQPPVSLTSPAMQLKTPPQHGLHKSSSGSFVASTPDPSRCSTMQTPFHVIQKPEIEPLVNTVQEQANWFATQVPVVKLLHGDLRLSVTAHLFATGSGFGPCQLFGPCNGSSGQSVIWAIEILSCLCLASYSEDSYGSVQLSLGRILVLFANGLEAVDRHFRLANLAKSHGTCNAIRLNPLTRRYRDSTDFEGYSDPELEDAPSTYLVRATADYTAPYDASPYYRFASDPTLPLRLHATLHWAVTNCLNQFGPHLGSIHMSAEARRKLEHLRKV